jgi:tRNA (guanine37-N1)-methyltransferase
MFEGPLDEGMLRVARESGRVELRILNLRDYTDDPHRTIDDYPYGGGPGMILKIEPVVRALESLPPPLIERREVVLLTPQGERLDQARVRKLVQVGDVALVLGRYKGIDERVRSFVTREISIGDYILSGAEPAALVIADALARLVPGVLGDLDSAEGDSFERQILDSAYYTRPEEFRGLKVPEVLLSGHHAKVAEARRRDALERTLRRRPDLLEDAALSPSEERWLRERGWTGRKGSS